MRAIRRGDSVLNGPVLPLSQSLLLGLLSALRANVRRGPREVRAKVAKEVGVYHVSIWSYHRAHFLHLLIRKTRSYNHPFSPAVPWVPTPLFTRGPQHYPT